MAGNIPRVREPASLQISLSVMSGSGAARVTEDGARPALEQSQRHHRQMNDNAGLALPTAKIGRRAGNLDPKSGSGSVDDKKGSAEPGSRNRSLGKYHRAWRIAANKA